MIIFGFRSRIFTLAMLTLVCGRCSNPAAHALRKVVRKFTLFFIPLFPVSVKYYNQCTFCGASTQLNKEQAEGLLAQNVAAQAPQQQAPDQQASSASDPQAEQA